MLLINDYLLFVTVCFLIIYFYLCKDTKKVIRIIIKISHPIVCLCIWMNYHNLLKCYFSFNGGLISCCFILTPLRHLAISELREGFIQPYFFLIFSYLV